VRLSDWRGQLVLLNIWATWCAPCKAELPSLDRLQAKLGGKGFTVRLSAPTVEAQMCLRNSSAEQALLI